MSRVYDPQKFAAGDRVTRVMNGMIRVHGLCVERSGFSAWVRWDDGTEGRISQDLLKRARGFAAIQDRKLAADIASKGGKASHAQGRGHEFTSEEARAAGCKGGLKTSANRAHMASIGSKGGKASAKS